MPSLQKRNNGRDKKSEIERKVQPNDKKEAKAKLAVV